ncbi:phage tail assembly chaperone [Erythrobacter litoralis]|uniref:phage tail assembly chaperone n=1 Tax=Erythrobacter litoralis TaxID=39960 RepID=UPI002435A58A|nr:phage tail assembly chaperone [Erythrobacter litoralis]MDG6079186.1 phage tail assembly chaperone [Erythrobacter litoralis]
MTAFATQAARLADHAARSLGWTPDTFWNATPSELAASLHSDDTESTAPPSRERIAAMIERDRHD